jgi:hypothetical protein
MPDVIKNDAKENNFEEFYRLIKYLRVECAVNLQGFAKRQVRSDFRSL